MKRIFSLLAVTTLFFAAQASARGGGEERDLNFQRYDSTYFEKNNSGLKGEKSYLVLTDHQQFDKVFGPAARMSGNTFLPRDTFTNKIVVAAIKRGTMRRYSDVAVKEENGILLVSYTATDDKPGGATYRVPLILAVDKGEYGGVVFMENGERVGVVCLRQGQ
jgi:hypothetical protein